MTENKLKKSPDVLDLPVPFSTGTWYRERFSCYETESFGCVCALVTVLFVKGSTKQQTSQPYKNNLKFDSYTSINFRTIH
jgi:hypothetical protein